MDRRSHGLLLNKTVTNLHHNIWSTAWTAHANFVRKF